MTIPSDFRTQTKVINRSGIIHPVYVFSINLDRPTSELIGPNTNQRSVNLLHPSMHQTSPDRGRSEAAVHDNGNLGWISGLFPGMNIEINSNGTITAFGKHAIYLKRNYADVTNPMLTLINHAPYISEELTVDRDYGVKCAGSASITQPRSSHIASGGAECNGEATVAFTDN